MLQPCYNTLGHRYNSTTICYNLALDGYNGAITKDLWLYEHATKQLNEVSVCSRK